MTLSRRARLAARALPLFIKRDDLDIEAARRRVDRLPTPPNPKVDVDEIRVGGVVAYQARPKGAAPARHLLHIHGGGFAINSARGSRGWIADLAIRAEATVVSVEYRLAPEHPAPAAIDDCMAAYQGLLEVADAADIGFIGESAGGGAAVSTALRARDEGLPLPAAIVALSPWVDLTLSGDSIVANDSTDAVLGAALAVWRDAYVGDLDPSDPSVSPLFADLTGLPPLHVQVATTEKLEDDARRLVVEALAAGVDAELVLHDGLFHVFQLLVPFVPEAVAATETAVAFLRRHT